MTGVLVWKVFREQRSIWLAMAILALAVMVLDLTLLGTGGPPTGPVLFWGLGVFFCAIAYIYGLVVSGMLLAGERETGTASFLETLPVKALTVWQAKLAAGTGLILAQALFLGSVLLGAALLFRWNLRVVASAELGLFSSSLLGFAWGLFFSGRTKTSMGAVLAAVLSQALAVPLWFGLCTLIDIVGQWLLKRTQPSPNVDVDYTLATLLVLGPVFVAWIGQARLDRLRQLDTDQSPSSGDWRSKLVALVWLDLRQTGRLFKWLAIAALIVGILGAIASESQRISTARQASWPLGILAWPVLTLLLGVIGGVSVFVDEQTEGASRFLGDQRLPPGLVWASKVSLHFALTVGVALVLAFLAAARLALMAAEQSPGMEPSEVDRALVPFLQWGPFLTLWLIYGFSVGCLCGLLFHKPVIAGCVALGAALALTALWAPSLVVGGLHPWQYLGVPALLLLTTCLLMWPWATGRLRSASAMLRLSACLLFAGLWMAGAIGYRVIEIPLVKDNLDLAGLERQLQEDRSNGAGQRVSEVLREIGSFMRTAGQRRLPPPGWVPVDDEKAPTVKSRIWQVAFGGWPANAPGLDAWLNEAFQQRWAAQLKDLKKLPLGIVEDFQDRNRETPLAADTQVEMAAHLLVARGLQLQAHGDPAAFVEDLDIGLALMRQVRHRESRSTAWGAEWVLLQFGVPLWLEHLGNQPKLLRRVLAVLVEHEKAIRNDPSEVVRTEYLLTRNTIRNPQEALARLMKLPSRNVALGLVVLAWTTPWEQARLQRLVRQEANEGETPFPLVHNGPIDRLRSDITQLNRYLSKRTSDVSSLLSVSELMVALRLYQAEMGKPATTLDELTPKFLESLPIGPFSGMPIEYRVSRGEEIRLRNPAGRQPWVTRRVPAGQGILTVGNTNYLVPPPASP